MEAKIHEQVVDFLMQQPCAKKSINGKQVMFRCPKCGDSRKSSTSTNFSVSIDTEDDKPMMYQCFRAECKAKGIVDQDFLQLIGFTKYDVVLEISKYNKRVAKTTTQTGLFKSMTKKKISNVVNVADSKVNEVKLRYINKRLGTNFTFEDIYNLKINLDSNHLLRFNGVDIPKKYTRLYKLYGDYGVSFISAYNDYVIVRDISKDGKLPHRYNNINIFNNYDDVTKYYCIPSMIDLLSPDTTVLNVSEGAFDIIGVKYNLDVDREYPNQIFAAACGAGIVNVVMHYIRQYGLTNLKINIFSDNDVNIQSYNGLYKLKPYLDNFDVTIYYNTISKDFGVSKDNISYVTTRL